MKNRLNISVHWYIMETPDIKIFLHNTGHYIKLIKFAFYNNDTFDKGDFKKQ